MIPVHIRSSGNIHSVELFEQSYSELARNLNADLAPESAIMKAREHLDLNYKDNYVPTGNLTKYLIRGVLITITQQGFRHFKSICFKSDLKDSLVDIVNELGFDLKP